MNSAVRAPSDRELGNAGGSFDLLTFALARGLRDRACDGWLKLRPAFIGTSYRTIVHGSEDGADSQSSRRQGCEFRGHFPLRYLRDEEIRSCNEHRVRIHGCVRQGQIHSEVHHPHLAHLPDDLADVNLPIFHSVERTVVVGRAVECMESNGSRERVVVHVALVDCDNGRTFVGADSDRLTVPLVGEAGHGLGGGRCDGKNAKHSKSLPEWRSDLDQALSYANAVCANEAGVHLERVSRRLLDTSEHRVVRLHVFEDADDVEVVVEEDDVEWDECFVHPERAIGVRVEHEEHPVIPRERSSMRETCCVLNRRTSELNGDL